MEKNKTTGIWIKYDRGGDYQKLSESFKDYATTWGIEKESIAKDQLSGGDMYVYYVKNKDGEYKENKSSIKKPAPSMHEYCHAR